MSVGGTPLIGAVTDAIDELLKRGGQVPKIGAGTSQPPPANPAPSRFGASALTAPPAQPALPQTAVVGAPGGTAPFMPAKIGASQPAVPSSPKIGAAMDTYDPSRSPMVATQPDYAAQYAAVQDPTRPAPDAGKPSMLRKIGGIALGAGIGAFNPQAGAQIGSSIVNGPRNELMRDYNQQELAANQQRDRISKEAGLAHTGSQIEQEQAQAAKERADAANVGQPKSVEEKWSVNPNFTGPKGEPIETEEHSGQMRYSTLQGTQPLKPPTVKNEKYATLQLPNGQKAPGKEDSQGNLLQADGTPAPKGTITYQQPNYGQLVLPTKTQNILVNGIPTEMGWNEKTQKYDIPQGQSASGAYAHEEAQAGAVQRAGTDLKADIQANRAKLGNVEAIVNSAFLGTPLADPVAAGLATKLASYAALNPALHGAKGMAAIQAFEKMVGGIPKNPDALIASIDAISQTAGAINPGLPKPSGAAGATEPKGNWNPKTGKYE